MSERNIPAEKIVLLFYAGVKSHRQSTTSPQQNKPITDPNSYHMLTLSQ